jgi:hypothetical protein
VSSCATCLPEIEVSATAAKHSLVTSSIHVQNAEASTAGELVVDEVDRPAAVTPAAVSKRLPKGAASA